MKRKSLRELSTRQFNRIVKARCMEAEAELHSTSKSKTIVPLVFTPSTSQTPSTSNVLATDSMLTELVPFVAQCNSVVSKTTLSSFNVDMFESDNSSETNFSFSDQPFKPNSSTSEESVLSEKYMNESTVNANTQQTAGLGHKLVQWYCENNINHQQLNALLAILREHPCHSTLPKDARTLLSTPRATQTVAMPPGEYFHLGLRSGLLKIIDLVGVDMPSNIKILVGVDGLPISKSSGSAFWPILCHISTLPESTIFPVGIYHGEGKPSDCNAFMRQFVEEAVSLVTHGITVGVPQRKFDVYIVGVICDAPAKSFICNTKGHGGYNSCSKCIVEGEYINNRVCFPDTNAMKRTHTSFINQDHEEYHLGNTLLVTIPGFDMITNIPLDYMHLICLGVVRKLLRDMWLKGKPPNKLQYKKVQEMSSRLFTFKNYIPREFARKPRPLEEVSRWKATEFREFLLYTGPLTTKSVLPASMYMNFMTLHVATRILASPQYHSLYKEYAKSLLLYFVKSFGQLYGVEYISHNVHALIHIVDDVNTFGPLDKFSAFRFENYMQQLKKLVKKPEKPLQQVIHRLAELKKLNKCVRASVSGSNKTPAFEGLHDNGPLLYNSQDPQFSTMTFKNLKLSNQAPNNCCGLSDGTVIIVENFSQYKHSKNIMVIGKKFECIFDLYDKPCKSSLIGIYKVSNLSLTMKDWPVEQISVKYMKLPCIESDEYGVFPLLHS